MQAVIMAGGNKTQLYPITANIPKPLLPIFDRPVMEHCIKLLAKHKITDIIVTLSYLAKDIIYYFGDGTRFGVNIRYFVETEPQGTAGGIKLVQNMIEDTFVVLSGDAVTDIDLTAALDMHRKSSAIASLMLYKVDNPGEFGIVECDTGGKITRFLEKPKSSEVFTDNVNTGIYIFEPEVLSCIPYYQQYDFSRELFPRMLNNQEPIYGITLPGYWCDVGNLPQYLNAHFDALEGRVKLELPATHIGKGVWLGERVEVDNSVELSSPVFLGAGARVRRDASLGKRTIIGSETLVDEGADITRSVIGSNSHIARNTHIADCVIGSGYSTNDNDDIQDQSLVSHVHYEIETELPIKKAPVPTFSQVAEEIRLAGKA